MQRFRTLVVIGACSLGVPSFASDCPAVVKGAAEKAHSGAKIVSCEQEKEEGQLLYEVRITTEGGKKLELDISPEGTVLQTEERVTLEAVPDAVLRAFRAKYPDAKPAAAEMQTGADGKVSYEIAFDSANGKREATFAENGTMIEEEEDEGEEGDEPDDD